MIYLLIIHKFVERKNVFRVQKVKVSNLSIQAKELIGHLGVHLVITYHFLSQNYQRQIILDEIS